MLCCGTRNKYKYLEELECRATRPRGVENLEGSRRSTVKHKAIENLKVRRSPATTPEGLRHCATRPGVQSYR